MIYIYIHIRVKPSDKHSRSVLSQLCTMEVVYAAYCGKMDRKIWLDYAIQST